MPHSAPPPGSRCSPTLGAHAGVGAHAGDPPHHDHSFEAFVAHAAGAELLHTVQQLDEFREIVLHDVRRPFDDRPEQQASPGHEAVAEEVRARSDAALAMAISSSESFTRSPTRSSPAREMLARATLQQSAAAQLINARGELLLRSSSSMVRDKPARASCRGICERLCCCCVCVLLLLGSGVAATFLASPALWPQAMERWPELEAWLQAVPTMPALAARGGQVGGEVAAELVALEKGAVDGFATFQREATGVVAELLAFGEGVEKGLTSLEQGAEHGLTSTV